MSESDVRGRFLWYDLMTKDPQGSKEFYTKVVGWGLQTFPDPSMPYTMFTANGTPIGGSMHLPDEAQKMGAPSHWLAYIGTPDVDKTMAQVMALGGKTYVPAQDIPEVGRFAVAADPQGATIAFYTPLKTQPPSHAPAVGEMSWHELVTTDPVAAVSFYNSLVGWTTTGEHDMGPMGVYRMFGRGDVTLGGVFKKPAEMPAPPHWMIYIRVPDIRAATDLATANGAQVLHGPAEVPGGDWIVQCMDPQGAAFAMHQRKA